jgi:hypothetical protein
MANDRPAVNYSKQRGSFGVEQDLPSLPAMNRNCCLLSQCFPAPFLVQGDGIDLFIGRKPGPHDDRPDPGIHDHLGAEETGGDESPLLGIDLKTGEIERTPSRELACLQQSVHLGVHAPALLIVGPRWNVVLPPPAPIQFRAIHLFTGCPCIPCGYDGIVLIDNDGTKIPPEAGSLMGATERKIQKVLVAVGSHHRVIGEFR